MNRAPKLVAVMIVALAVLTWAAAAIVQRTTRRWFEDDLSLRAELAVNGARRTLISRWSNGPELSEVLSELARDERIMAAAACTSDFELLASTRDYPQTLSCRSLGAQMNGNGVGHGANLHGHRQTSTLPGGQVHVSAIPLVSGDQTNGFVVLVHDLSFVERRELSTRRFLIGAFAFLALLASCLTFAVARWSWRRWSDELRRQIRGEQPPPPERQEFGPIMRDVRELVDRIATERESEQENGTWSAERLKQTLIRHFHGEKVIVVANREPYIHERLQGEVIVKHPASGLVTALEPVMRACSGVWIAHGSGGADRDTVDPQDHVRVPPGEESYLIRRVWLNEEEEKGYYFGFANEGLWPLCHIADARPAFRADDFAHYRAVNERFVSAVCEEVDADDPIVLVQDYHFALVPQLLRERLPRATVITFWHIPWPNSERFGICPWRKELIAGLLGSSIVGFHTRADCNNFLDAADRYLEARIDRDEATVVRDGHKTLVRPYPISVEWPAHHAQNLPDAQECRRQLIEELSLPANASIGVGVDRLDYTKGIEERLLTVERLLERFPELVGRFVFVQLAAPSRTAIERYRQLDEIVSRTAQRVNDRFGSDSYRPIVLLRSHHEPPRVYHLYRAADVCYVSSLHDGMNLVAKEFIAARDDERGVLVLSQFTGAARELPEALIVNPYDLDQASAALAAGLSMSVDEQRERMHSMRTYVSEFNVYRWAGRMLVDAARLRRRGRLRLNGNGLMAAE